MTNASHLPPSLSLRILPILFFASGASSLTLETVFTRLLTYTFGNTAHAVSTVLATFLGGLALGAWLLGRWVDRRAPSLMIYAGLELLVALYCLLIPLLFSLLTGTYVALHHRLALGDSGLLAARVLLASIVIIIPSFLMGGTLPAVSRFVTAGAADAPWRISRLYAWNTLGAAAGTLCSTYLLMPKLGLRGAIAVAAGTNVLIFLIVLLLRRRPGETVARPEEAVASELPVPSGGASLAPLPRRRAAVLLAGAFVTGALALAYEVVWTHALAFFIGNTVYAFGVMLFTFLCGLGLGAQIVSRHLQRSQTWARALAGSQFALAIVVFATLPLWNRIPDLFAKGYGTAFELSLLAAALLFLLRMAYVAGKVIKARRGGQVPRVALVEIALSAVLLVAIFSVDWSFFWKFESANFLAGEALRFFISFYLLILPSFLLGLSFPLLLHLASHGARAVGARVGSLYASNTAGAIAGSLLAGFVVLPAWGTMVSLRAAATMNLALGLAFALILVSLPVARRALLAFVAASLALVFWTGSPGWHPERMSRGSYVYFTPGWAIDRVLFMKEDTQGGLTSVIQSGPTRILLSNGKFQGNNSGEVGAQVRFAMIPVLFASGFDRALVIGLGTGNTLRTVASFPFRAIDAVEIAPHIIEAAREWFADVNALVFDRDPRVRVSVADGRNFLLLSRDRYDLITIEVSSIWISGEADLYNKEFYELCRARMTERGVLQQWVQIHHMKTEDFLVILNTAAQAFPHVAFFLGPEMQGVLVASPAPLALDYAQMERFDADPRVRAELEAIDAPSVWSLAGEMALYGDSLKRALELLPELSGRPADFASTDWRPYLEYQTPKGNALPYNTISVNINFLRNFRELPWPRELEIRNLPSEAERSLILGLVDEHLGRLDDALGHFRSALEERTEKDTGDRLQGTEKKGSSTSAATHAKAQAGIERITSGESARRRPPPL